MAQREQSGGGAGPREAEERPFLEHRQGTERHRILLYELPFVMGRASRAHHVIDSKKVSQAHAQIEDRDGGLWVRDLDSTNGTFVNGERVHAQRLAEGDTIHVAHHELRFGYASFDAEALEEPTMTAERTKQRKIVEANRNLGLIFHQRLARAVFQPIVRLVDEALVGWEALGRNGLETTDYHIVELFSFAADLAVADQLSRLMRSVAIDESRKLPLEGAHVFMNMHPAEMDEPEDLFEDLATLELRPGYTPVMEVHESAVTDLGFMAELREHLHGHGIALAYDDFGAGQSRLRELIEVPPDYIKLDLGLVRGIDSNPARQGVVRGLTKIMQDLGIQVLAEGIETEGERDVCRELGAEFGQGYLFGRPKPA